MHKKLKDIAELVSGYTFRDAIKDDPMGSLLVLQGKNVPNDYFIRDLSGLVRISDDKIRNPYLLHQGDIIIVSRISALSSFRSAIFSSNMDNIMPSSSVYVIRIKDADIMPSYVSLYLNSEIGQKKIFDLSSGGSYIRTIPIKSLIALEIPIPSIERQQIIVSLCDNIEKQAMIMRRMQDIHKGIMEKVFNDQ
ncbi:MAG: EcoKI restriction-modification system protein HsdS [Parcubacteria group bacterium ADurb.Bin216]|nr:MAG: EcoKI restriction-modification system protein HsdS [Parcubacteria group bacterium ADurb.Bin216]